MQALGEKFNNWLLRHVTWGLTPVHNLLLFFIIFLLTNDNNHSIIEMRNLTKGVYLHMKKNFWTAEKSVTLSIIVTIILAVIFVGLIFTAPPVFRWFSEITGRGGSPYKTLIITFYVCCLPAAAALTLLMKLLLNIKAERIFISENVNLLRYLSWCCFLVVPITAVGGFFYISLFVITAAAAFIGLILRVLKNIMASATEIKAENDFTV